MTIEERKDGEVLTLVIEGKVDTITAPNLQNSILQAFQKSINVTLDFNNVEYVSSAGLRALLIGQKTAQSKKGSMVITGVNDTVKKVLELSGIGNLLSIQ